MTTVQPPDIAGQGITWDGRDGTTGGEPGVLYGIIRDSLGVVQMEVQLQDCLDSGDGELTVGTVLPVGTFEYDST